MTLVMMVGVVSAVHTSGVTVTTDDWLEADTETDFTVDVTNTDGTSSIRKIIIYPPAEYSSFTCGSAPTDWILSVGSESCTYSTLEPTEFITSGNSKDFTLQATTSSDVEYAWLVTTIDDGNDPYNNNPVPTGWTIQDVVDKANVGATVYIPAGTYNENVDIRKSIHLIGAGADITTIEPSSGRVINIRAQEATNGFIDGITIQGFTLRTNDNNYALQSNSATDGKYNGRNYLYKDLIVDANNNVQSAVGLFDVEGVILDNVVVKNSARTDGGAIEMVGVKDFTMSNSKITNNEIGLKIFDVSGYMPNEQIVISNSDLFGNNLYSIINDDAGLLVNAENNWWVVTTYDEIDALVEGEVEFDPWCYDAECSPDTTAPTIEFIGEPYFSQLDVEITIIADISDMRDIANYTIEFGDGKNETEEFNGNHDTEEQINVKHMYDGEDEYIVKLTVTDATGNSASETTVVLVSAEEPDWIISLSTRMNLISIPLVPEDIAIGKVFKEIRSNVEIVWSYQYDETTGENEWKWAEPKGSGWDTDKTLDSIIPGYGYIVFMEEDDVLYGTGKTIQYGDSDEEPVTPSEIHLANGYNLIGLFGTEEKPIRVALSSLMFWEEPYWHKVLYMDGSEVEGNLEPGEGYWISMKHLPNTATEDYYTYYL